MTDALTSVQEAELQAVLATVASIDASILERLHGDALLTGPPGWQDDLPREEHEGVRAALARAGLVLEDRLEQICEPDLVPGRWWDHRVSAAFPWCYLTFLVEAKVISIVAEDLVPQARLASLRRPRVAVFREREGSLDRLGPGDPMPPLPSAPLSSA